MLHGLLCTDSLVDVRLQHPQQQVLHQYIFTVEPGVVEVHKPVFVVDQPFLIGTSNKDRLLEQSI